MGKGKLSDSTRDATVSAIKWRIVSEVREVRQLVHNAFLLNWITFELMAFRILVAVPKASKCSDSVDFHRFSEAEWLLSGAFLWFFPFSFLPEGLLWFATMKLLKVRTRPQVWLKSFKFSRFRNWKIWRHGSYRRRLFWARLPDSTSSPESLWLGGGQVVSRWHSSEALLTIIFRNWISHVDGMFRYRIADRIFSNFKSPVTSS